MPQPRLYADGVCHNLQVSCPSQLKDDITALANAKRVSVGVFLVPFLREIVAKEQHPIIVITPSPRCQPFPDYLKGG